MSLFSNLNQNNNPNTNTNTVSQSNINVLNNLKGIFPSSTQQGQQQMGTSQSLFNSNNNNNIPSLFGQSNNSSLLGSAFNNVNTNNMNTGNTSTSLFGQNQTGLSGFALPPGNQNFNAESGFNINTNNNNAGFFNQTNTNQTGGLFNQNTLGNSMNNNNTTGGLFALGNNTNNNNNNLFNQQQPNQQQGFGFMNQQTNQSGGLFNQQINQSTGIFNQQQQQQKPLTGLFNQPNQNQTGSLFTSSSQPGSLFNQPNQQTNPSAGLFNQPNQSTGIYNQPNQSNSSTSLFSQSTGLFNQPPQSTNVFTQANPSPSIFNQPNQTTGGFVPANQLPGGGVFNQPNQTTGLFNSNPNNNNPSPSSNTGLFSNTSTGGLFSNQNQSINQPINNSNNSLFPTNQSMTQNNNSFPQSNVFNQPQQILGQGQTQGLGLGLGQTQSQGLFNQPSLFPMGQSTSSVPTQSVFNTPPLTGTGGFTLNPPKVDGAGGIISQFNNTGTSITNQNQPGLLHSIGSSNNTNAFTTTNNTQPQQQQQQPLSLFNSQPNTSNSASIFNVGNNANTTKPLTEGQSTNQQGSLFTSLNKPIEQNNTTTPNTNPLQPPQQSQPQEQIPSLFSTTAHIDNKPNTQTNSLFSAPQSQEAKLPIGSSLPLTTQTQTPISSLTVTQKPNEPNAPSLCNKEQTELKDKGTTSLFTSSSIGINNNKEKPLSQSSIPSSLTLNLNTSQDKKEEKKEISFNLKASDNLNPNLVERLRQKIKSSLTLYSFESLTENNTDTYVDSFIEIKHSLLSRKKQKCNAKLDESTMSKSITNNNYNSNTIITLLIKFSHENKDISFTVKIKEKASIKSLIEVIEMHLIKEYLIKIYHSTHSLFLMKNHSLISPHLTIKTANIKNNDILFAIVNIKEAEENKEAPKKKDLAPESSLPKLTLKEYKTIPDMKEIYRMTTKQLEHVKQFAIFNQHGKIEFEDEVDLTGINIDEIVEIGFGYVKVYKNTIDYPNPGEGLNKPAVVYMYNMIPEDHEGEGEEEKKKNDVEKAKDGYDKDKKKKKTEEYIKKLKLKCKEMKAEFVSYDDKIGELIYKISHF